MKTTHLSPRRARWGFVALAAAALALAACAPPPSGPGTGTGGGDPYVEVEPNGTAATANPLGFNGMVWLRNGTISPAGDVDVFTFTPPDPLDDVTVNLSDPLGCANSQLTVLVLNAGGTTVFGTGSMGSFCGNGTVRLAGGQQYRFEVRNGGGPSATPGSTIQAFATAVVAVMGNGILEPPEQCDDGNTLNGDGCSATGQIE